MHPLANRPFLKMNGIGNEIVVLDLRGSGAAVTPADARAIARGEGLAYDQLMVLGEPRGAGVDAHMTIFNNDGSESGACGNGTRCVAWAMTRDGARDRVTLETSAGRLEAVRAGATRFTVDMGAPRLDWRDIPLAHAVPDLRAVRVPEAGALGAFAAVNMGNPHAVFFVEDAMAVDLAAIGPVLERHPIFPERANISVAQVRPGGARPSILLRVWERGAGITRACGSAACATLVAAALTGRTGRAADVELPGGVLDIAWRESDSHVLMTGDVELEFEGRFAPGLFAGVEA
ncbi:MAG TPA: diaminopimelate epimerase [Beijerinckiaceae bacterium]